VFEMLQKLSMLLMFFHYKGIILVLNGFGMDVTPDTKLKSVKEIV